MESMRPRSTPVSGSGAIPYAASLAALSHITSVFAVCPRPLDTVLIPKLSGLNGWQYHLWQRSQSAADLSHFTKRAGGFEWEPTSSPFLAGMFVKLQVHLCHPLSGCFFFFPSQELTYPTTFPKVTFNPSKQITMEISYPSLSS